MMNKMMQANFSKSYNSPGSLCSIFALNAIDNHFHLIYSSTSNNYEQRYRNETKKIIY
ncbi:hypothetical protein Lmor_1691 [Legionella moravica]|uniref:Uncharacterized protein n=1 Tax=Legionella moravica TaxID=39962 RepID=A0A378K154_9GAMM|nr:hypothetical protein Lmor_1691 [Legionella moravica]STX64010.1 Uncharacterised protein [Legionella moravica]